MAAKLGELLASRGKLERDVLLRALRAQRSSGGRLGTLLLELDAVAEDDLLNVLSDQLKVPFVEADDLRGIAPEVLRLVPAKTAAKLGAIPVRASASQLTVAMLDPLDLAALDELAFVSGRRVRPHVALEVRIQEALARHYKVDTPVRFVKLADRLSRARYLWRQNAEDVAAGGPPTTGGEVPPGGLAAAEPPSPYLALPPRAPATPPPAPAPLSPPPPASESTPSPRAPAAASPLAFETAESRLAQPTDRDAVADTLIAFLAGRVDAALALMVRRDEAIGWRGLGLPQNVVAAVRVSLTEPSLVVALREGAPVHRGPLAQLSGNAPLVAAIGADAADLLALPLRVRDRLVGVLIALDRRRPFDPGLAEDVHRLVVKASGALEQLVLRQKLGKT